MGFGPGRSAHARVDFPVRVLWSANVGLGNHLANRPTLPHDLRANSRRTGITCGVEVFFSDVYRRRRIVGPRGSAPAPALAPSIAPPGLRASSPAHVPL